MNGDWKHIKTLVDGDPFTINGLNIWDFDWKNTGQRINVKDSLYEQDYTMIVFGVLNEGIRVIFAAGEFSNSIWGIYQQSPVAGSPNLRLLMKGRTLAVNKLS